MRIIFILAGFMALGFSAQAAPPLSAYGELPNVDHMAISPDGKHFAYILRDGETEALVIFNIDEGVTGGAKIEEGKMRRVFFVTDQHVILQATVTQRKWQGKFEDYDTGSYNIRTNNLVRLPKGRAAVTPRVAGVVGVLEEENQILMPAYVGGRYSVLGIDLDEGDWELLHEAGFGVWDWFVDTDGTALAREDFAYDGDYYTVRTQRNGEWESVYAERVDEPPFTVAAVKPDKSSLLAYDDPEGSGFSNLFELSFAGERSDPVFARDDAEIDRIFTDLNRFMIGVQYSGLYPSFEFYDPGLTDAMAQAQAVFPGSSVSLVDWTDDKQQLLLHVAGSRRAPAYYLYRRQTGAVLKIAGRYAGVSDADVGEILTIEYAARDGLKIPAVVTLPPDVQTPDNLPMIVIPHGGPQSYDRVDFDWQAQYFASRGYLVFQPNFRGSGGFGAAFTEAGHGEWGGKMQDDITDGVNLLVRNGWADKDRICIIGSSYGGYAALAAGAFTPSLYKCVGAVAAISDVKETLRRGKRDRGRNSLTYKRWEKMIGRLRDDEKLETISPVNHAANFTAPVLLIHGEDDSVVYITHSRRMEKALQDAGKEVEFVVLSGEDHWLSNNETRLQALRALDAFVEKSIGRN